MSPVERVRALVEQGVRERLLPVLLESAAKRHTRVQKAWKECDCEWCTLKRDATADIANQFMHPIHERPYWRRKAISKYRLERIGLS